VKLRRITKISVETNEAFTLRTGCNTSAARCPQCGSPAATLSHAESAALFWAAIRTIGDPVMPERIHVTKKESGAIAICLDSLRKAAPDLAGKSILEMKTNKESTL